MKEKKKKKRGDQNVRELILSPRKRLIYTGAAFLLPFLGLLLLEAGLRIFQYDGNVKLFIDGPPGYEEYIRCNPNVARRYFFAQSSIPTPPKQLFYKKKPHNGYRIFVLGESSAAGFPYGNNVSFPNILERSLSNTFPEKRIEVVNIALSAINSYSLLDFMDEILEQSPDAILIYTGHNEYYGALGVGSVQSLGNSRWLIHTYLKLQSIKVFLLLRDCIGWIRMRIGTLLYQGNEIDPSATLMERVVAEQTIPSGSPLYEAGKRQFEENMEAIIQKAAEKKIPLILSELVSNIKDQTPFISVVDSGGHSAETWYSEARHLEKAGAFVKAKELYQRSKDTDALRFRAPEEFNIILKGLAEKYTLPIVPAVSYFENESENGLIGNNLLLEHLHPNVDGYFLLAKAFYETMQKNRFISSSWAEGSIERERGKGLTSLDSVYGALVVQQLKSGWPFQPKSLPNRFIQNYFPKNKVEEIAFRVLQGTNFSLESGHMELGAFYEKQDQWGNAFLEYNALITSIPHEIEFYQKAATVLISQKRFDEASRILQKSLVYKNNMFANKWIGQIALMKGEYAKAASFLQRADLLDSQVLFNLCRAYYSENEWEKGEGYYLRLKNLAPHSEYFNYLKKMRLLAKIKRDGIKANQPR